MGKKERRAALEFILDNEVIVRKISEAMGCDPAMKNRERKNLIEDMKSQFDISATEVAEAKEAVCKYKRYLKALSITCATLVFVLMNIILDY